MASDDVPTSKTPPAAAGHSDEDRLAQVRLAELEATYATAPVGLCVLDADLRFVRINQHLAEMNGVPVEDHIGRTIRDVVPDVAEKVEPVLRQILETGEPVLDFELTGETASAPGVQRTWVESWYPLRDEQGRIIGVNVVADEVTDQKRVEEERDHERSMFEAVLDALPAGVMITDAEGRIVRVNEVTNELWGVPPETQSWEDYGNFVGWWPQTGERIKAEEWAMSRALNQGEVTRGELVRNQRFGSQEQRYYLNNVAPVRDSEGRIIGGVAAMLDVTDRLADEEALRESEERYRMLFESIDEGFCVLEVIFDDEGDPVDYRFIEINPAFEQQTGLVDAAGKTALELIPGLEGHWFETYGRVATTGERERFVEESPAMGRWFEVEAFRVGAPDQHRVALLFSDITERRRSEQALRDLNATLESQVEKRTSQVRSLAAHLAIAEQRERRRLAHILHDDLQQQLYGLSMLLPLVAQSSTEEAARYLQRAEMILDSALVMTRDLSSDLRPSVLDSVWVHDMLRWLVERVREQHGLAVELDADEECIVPDPTVRTVLYDSLREILFNVVKHAGAEDVRVGSEERDGDVLVWVRDDGVGFSPDTEGGGFGLASVRDRLNLVGGRLTVVSTPGEGAEVTISVPQSVGETLSDQDGGTPESARRL